LEEQITIGASRGNPREKPASPANPFNRPEMTQGIRE
jgi:hypothetical protein